ncbi:hypothetical protein BDBG_06518 [Blastomyces gilchristii SLH14081]|uniref:F-box domain-containing protein n=1 Tax=Blastomyces gilchristii (strain SLH14081) TaxID=559298 RepID=A0A179UU71_BLAGS|nr:uncharacterized protein BDBG_06518 [Blastomyces gilchristii SLH14081]OAT10708.1 hypothetical protein BDBG_06518 [Blastomyces gilchristii SLH14081]
MTFLNLPPELIINIADQIPNKRDLNNFSQTCRDLHSILNNYLYRHDAKSGDPQALFWAAYKGRKSTARKALSHGVDIHAGDPSPSPFPDPFPIQSPSRRQDSCPPTLYFTPLQIATCYGHESMVRFLIQHGADPHTPFPAHHGGCLLHVACCSGPAGLLRLLLEQGVEVDVRNSKGWTPLYCAVRPLLLRADSVSDNRKRVAAARVRLLLDYGADPDAVTKAGKSPRLLAKRCRDPYVRMMLLGGKGAKVSLHEASLEGRRFRGDSPLKERGVVEKRGILDAEVGNGLDKNDTSTSMAPGPVVGSKSKRPHRRTKKDKKKRRNQQLEVAEGDTEGKGEVKEVVGIGVTEQDSITPVRLVNLNDNTANATARRQTAWAKMRAEASQRELEAKRGQELPTPFSCVHQAGGMFRMKRKTECGSCGNVAKRSFRCPVCEVALCSKCVK